MPQKRDRKFNDGLNSFFSFFLNQPATNPTLD
jgi:hypothetical protein